MEIWPYAGLTAGADEGVDEGMVAVTDDKLLDSGGWLVSVPWTMESRESHVAVRIERTNDMYESISGCQLGIYVCVEGCV